MLPSLNLPAWTVTLVTVLVVLGFFLAVTLAWAFDIGPDGQHKTSKQDSQQASADEAEPSQSHTHHKDSDQHRSIAVLPFVNMSGDEENEYFSDGVAEEILNLLTRLPQLRVSSGSSSFAYKGEQIENR